MKRLRNIARGFLCRHCPRYKLWRICRAIGIKAYPWQRDFALQRRLPINELYGGRRNGKTLAVMIGNSHCLFQYQIPFFHSTARGRYNAG